MVISLRGTSRSSNVSSCLVINVYSNVVINVYSNVVINVYSNVAINVSSYSESSFLDRLEPRGALD